MVPQPSQNTVGVCNHIYHILILYYISSRLVTLPKAIDATVQVSDRVVLMLLFVSGISILSFEYSFLFLKFVIRHSKGGDPRIAGFSTTRYGENVTRMEEVKAPITCPVSRRIA